MDLNDDVFLENNYYYLNDDDVYVFYFLYQNLFHLMMFHYDDMIVEKYEMFDRVENDENFDYYFKKKY
jgi:hypothetical protein